MMINYLPLLKKLASELRIQTTFIELPVRTNREFPDLGLRSALFGPDASFLESMPPADSNDSNINIWTMQDTFQCHYFLGTDPLQKQLWLLGPYLTEDFGISDIRRNIAKAGVFHADLSYLRQYYRIVPLIQDENLLYCVVRTLLAESGCMNETGIHAWEMVPSQKPVPADNAFVQTEYHQDVLAHLYLHEQRMMECISRGNYDGAVSAIHRLEGQGPEARIPNTLRDMKNYLIVFNTLCRLAARDGGVSPWKIDRYSQEVSIAIENAAGIHELAAVQENILSKYCSLVQNVQNSMYSPTVQQMINLMETRFSQNLTLAEIARMLSHNSNYLSIRFKEETGKTFSEFLADVRLAFARKLLRETNMPVTSIAAECGIPDNNYFSRLFRKHEHMTPTQFRAKSRCKLISDEKQM